MRLTFKYTKTAGTGLSPQAVHMMDNGLRFIYLTSDGLVEAKECFPDMGLYDGINTRQYRAGVMVKFHIWLALVIPGTSVHVALSVEYCIFKLSICAAGTVLISIFIRLHSF